MTPTWKYVCKYTPVELLSGFDLEAEPLNPNGEGYALADQYIHSNVCSFSRAIVETRVKDPDGPIILTSCCDSIERTADVLKHLGQEVYLLDLPHDNRGCCAKLLYKKELLKLLDYLQSALKRQFSAEKFYRAFSLRRIASGSPDSCAFAPDSCALAPGAYPGGHCPEALSGKYISIMGARVNPDLLELIEKSSPLPVKNNTCTGTRSLCPPPECGNIEDLMAWYADALLSQVPCMRMTDISLRRDLTEDPNLCGIIYNTVSFCDFYTFEYARLKECLKVPILKIETDYTWLATEQIKTRLGAFYENLVARPATSYKKVSRPRAYYAGIDSGSTSTNAVIIDSDKNIISFATVPTGAKVAESAQKALEQALNKAGLQMHDILRIVTTGYGRARIGFRTKDITEITCHAKGAYFLNPRVRTVIDIGGQDSKVIKLDASGNVVDFVMNDKCAAGTGRFIELMAQSLQLSLEQMCTYGLKWDEDITISSMCSVFAQSEVVSLIASDKKLEDIVHGINNSIASKIVSMGRRVKFEKEFMMTGGVARNIGVVRAIEEKLGSQVIVPQQPDICGALGAALIALEG